MAEVQRESEAADVRIMLRLLTLLGRDSGTSQRRLSAKLGIALGLVNAYLKRCVMKGLVKASQAPSRRYAYYVTPKGFAEKSRLTVEYLSHSLGFFREARSDCANVLRAALANGHGRIVLVGKSDIAEIMIICAVDCDIDVVGVIDDGAPATFSGCNVFTTCDAVTKPFDAVVVTGLQNLDETFRDMTMRFGKDRVFVPNILRQQMLAGEAE
jgi:DNA-binding MarR family transcriptional regulator